MTGTSRVSTSTSIAHTRPMETQETQETPWHAKFPAPKSKSETMSQDDLAELLRTKKAGVDYAVVDVRRNDFEVSHSGWAVRVQEYDVQPSAECDCEGCNQSACPVVLHNPPYATSAAQPYSDGSVLLR